MFQILFFLMLFIKFSWADNFQYIRFSSETAPIGIIRKMSQFVIPEEMCSAALVAPDYILTAAHCIEKLGYGSDIEFVAGYRGRYGLASSPFEGTVAYFGNSLQLPQNDWALVKLKKKIGNLVGWLGIEKSQERDELMLISYPFELLPKVISSQCQSRKIGDHIILHGCASAKGSSGAPLLKKNHKGQLVIVGIHSCTFYGQEYKNYFLWGPAALNAGSFINRVYQIIENVGTNELPLKEEIEL